MAIRKRTELTRFSRAAMGELLLTVAKGKIIGPLFLGEFHEQEVRWMQDGSCEVVTTYSQGDWEDFYKPDGTPRKD